MPTPANMALLNLAFGRTRFVCLRREDVLAQAVSWLRAEQTDTWYIGGNGEIGGNGGRGQLPVFDADRIGELVQIIDEHNAAWEAWFATCGISPLRVRYEELDTDMAGVTEGILTFLGLSSPDGRAIVPRHKRQADELNDQWIERYRAESAQR
ncbi:MULTISPECIES: Stf0 family sulfotransferase [Streptomyces]|uniref:Stf0 family sulfotransferase n=1 Tax=Streptomyces TaxID=1883 RepID=UPI00142D7BD3|nr:MULTISPECIES: Stf0 family sulfotransferase [Streptomyces]